MPPLGFQPAIAEFGLAKTFHTLNFAAIVTGMASPPNKCYSLGGRIQGCIVILLQPLCEILGEDWGWKGDAGGGAHSSIRINKNWCWKLTLGGSTNRRWRTSGNEMGCTYYTQHEICTLRNSCDVLSSWSKEEKENTTKTKHDKNKTMWYHPPKQQQQ
jgi:hypothetical protein